MISAKLFPSHVVELSPGDVIHYIPPEDLPILKPGEIFNFQSVQTVVTLIIKDPPYKKWYQFWIKPKIVGYHLQVLPDQYRKEKYE